MHSWHWQLVSLLCLPASPLSRESIHLKRHGSLEQEPSCAHARLKGQAKATESEGRGERIPTSDSATAMVLESAESAPGARGERERERERAARRPPYVRQRQTGNGRGHGQAGGERARATGGRRRAGAGGNRFFPMPCQDIWRGWRLQLGAMVNRRSNQCGGGACG